MMQPVENVPRCPLSAEQWGPTIFCLLNLLSLWHIHVTHMLYKWQKISVHHLHTLSTMWRMNIIIGKIIYGFMEVYILSTLLYPLVTHHLIWLSQCKLKWELNSKTHWGLEPHWSQLQNHMFAKIFQGCLSLYVRVKFYILTWKRTMKYYRQKSSLDIGDCSLEDNGNVRTKWTKIAKVYFYM